MRLSRYALPRASASGRPSAVLLPIGKNALDRLHFESSTASHGSRIYLARSNASSLSSPTETRELRQSQHLASSEASRSHPTRPGHLKLSLYPSSVHFRVYQPQTDPSSYSSAPFRVIQPRTDPSTRSSTEYRIIRPSHLRPSPDPKAPDGPISQFNNSDEGGSKMELVVPISGLSQDVVSALNEIGIQRDEQQFRFEVDSTKTDSHTRYTARRRMTRLPDTAADANEREMAQIFKSWLSTLRRLEHMTPVASMDWAETTITGTKWLLLELYNYILSTFRNRAIPSYPVIPSDQGSMSISGEEDCIREIERHYLEMKGATVKIENLVSDKHNGSSVTDRGISTAAYSPVNSQISPEYVLQDLKCPPEDQASFLKSKEELSQYIEALTKLWKPGMISGQEIKRDWMKAEIEDTLTRLLFNSDNTKPFVSFVALHRALSFRVEDLKSRTGQQFIAEMERIGFSPNAESFNILLPRYANWSHYTIFNKILDEMDRRGIAPNAGTWAALLAGVPTRQTGRQVANFMYGKGLLTDPALSRKYAQHIITFSFGPFLDDGGTVEDYFSVLDQIFGPGWSSRETNDAILNALGERLWMPEAIAATQRLMDKRAPASVNLGLTCLHTLLIHCKRQTNADLAVWLTVYAYEKWQVQDETDPIVLDLLFRLAWRSRMYNLLRVVWRYAIASARDGRFMRSIVRASLRESLKSDAKTVLGEWRASFGAVICRRAAHVPISPSTVVAFERRSLTGKKPLKPFYLMIVQALAQDKAWAGQGLKRMTSTQWKIENVIPVPFV